MTGESVPQAVAVPGAPPAARTSRRTAAITVLLGLSLTGVVVGALWAWVAPPIHAVVAMTRAGERVHDYLGEESQNFFIAPFLMLGLLGVVAVVAAVLVWQCRGSRGPGMVVTLSAGLASAAAVATAVGALLVRLRYGALDFDTVALASGEHSLTYVTQAPPVFFARRPWLVAATLLSPAATASLVYAMIAAGTARDDLGRYAGIGQASNAPVEPVSEAGVS
ncbi:hypothetical protein LAUMK41_02555 [Mycobacterium attenuatum]|uniref:DUF2567 domain-containing protein n=1 Tax=Mycobacterium attenuatum TaxID=2341086 RepID=A0A498Q060_9MYCO|nr:DUF2567 domain-containing protein [Mycobacterium attenuatum]VBA38429.1 hypothetical protein LAUMK136_02466 [Mycobacterium attenuatum]VBA57605.1 hypothetical protein LAUMK41_02555 [Mycobacterium attenuatum]